VFVARIANAIAAFFGHSIGPVAVQHAEVELLVVRQVLHTGDEGVLQRPVIRPLGEDFVDRGIVDFRAAVVIFGHR